MIFQNNIAIKYLDNSSKIILLMYRYLVKKIETRYSVIQDYVLKNLLEYIKKRDSKILEKIWAESSIQKDIFLFAVETYDNLTEGKPLELRDKNLYSNKIVVKLLSDYKIELENIYFNGNKTNVIDPLYSDENFQVFLVQKNEQIHYYEFNEIVFHIILDGLILIKNDILGVGDGIFSSAPPLLEKTQILTEDFSEIIFIIKNNFFKKMNYWDKPKTNEKKFFQNEKNFQDFITFLGKKDLQLNRLLCLYLGTYLLAFLEGSSVDLLDVAKWNQKYLILDIINKHIDLDNNEILEKLTTHFGISTSKFYKIFYELFTETPVKYIENIRFQKFYKVLMEKDEKALFLDDNITYSYKTLSKAFVKKTGISPKKMKKIFKNTNI